MSSSSVTPSRARIDAQLASWRSTRPGRLMLLGASIGLLAALYYVAAKIGLRLAYLNGTVTALWPPVGVGIAALVLYGTRLWPGIVIGDLLVADFSSPLGTVLGQTVGNTLEVVVAAVLLRRLIGNRTGLERVGDVFALVAAAAVGTLISASFGATSLRLGDVIPADQFARGLADVVAVGLLGRARGHAADPHLGDPRRCAGSRAGTCSRAPRCWPPSCCWPSFRRSATFRTSSSRCSSGPRCASGPAGAATALVVVSSLTVWNTAHNAGPFVRESITDSLLSSQLFLATAALTSLVLAAVTAERTRADEALRANEERLRSVVQSMAEGLIVRDATRDHHRLQRGRGADRRPRRAIGCAAGRPEDVVGAGGRRRRPAASPAAACWATRR